MMDDAVYEFITDSRQKKNIGISAKKKKGSVMGPRGCRLPSDSLTRKEIEKMNGEVKKYDMNGPVKYNEFKTWPEDIQREYLRNLVGKYSVAKFRVAEMLGISDPTMYQLCKGVGFKFPLNGGNDKTNIPAWEAFLSGGEKTQAEREDDTIAAIQRWYAGKTSESVGKVYEKQEDWEEYGAKRRSGRYPMCVGLRNADLENGENESDEHKTPFAVMEGTVNVEINDWASLFEFLSGIDISGGAIVDVSVKSLR